MKLLKELVEMYGDEISFNGFTLKQEEEYEEDNRKIWHTVYKNGKRLGTLDHSPYEYLDKNEFAQYVSFFNQHGRFPNREDIDSTGPLTARDLVNLV